MGTSSVPSSFFQYVFINDRVDDAPCSVRSCNLHQPSGTNTYITPRERC
jgi:hypothetical protein